MHDRTPRSYEYGFAQRSAAALFLVVAAVVSALAGSSSSAAGHATVAHPAQVVTGTGIHSFSTAIVHTEEPTPSGMIQRSSEIVTLEGDLVGHLLYHPTSTFDYAAGTLVNTGTQVFSGTVLGSFPVMLHDDRFRFEVDLETGATTGEVHLGRSGDAPNPEFWYECRLDVVGTGTTDAGDATFDYSGRCVRMEAG